MKLSAVLFSGLMLASTCLKAQEVVTTTANTNDVYYSMNTKEVKKVSNLNWDIAFEIKGFTGSILINDGAGVELYASPYAIADWANFDSTGHASWTSNINSRTSWSMGAFSLNSSSQIDLGWGIYNQGTHAVTGDSIFFLSLPNGTAKKMYIKDLTAGVYTFVYADLDGSNMQTKSIKVSDYATENFAYFSFEEDKALSREPDTKTWDIVFTKYLEPISIGGGKFLNYPVGGVKINKGVEVAQRNGKAVTDNDTMGLQWNTDITEIGSDWKQFDGTQYVIAADQVYFIRTTNGAVWKIYFTKYEGGTMANYHFNQELIMQSVGIEKTLANQIAVYPNPAASNSQINIELPVELNDAKVMITDAKGATVANEMNASSFTFNGASGVYYVHIKSNNGTIVKPLIIK